MLGEKRCGLFGVLRSSSPVQGCCAPWHLTSFAVRKISLLVDGASLEECSEGSSSWGVWGDEGKIYSSKISVLGGNKSCPGNRWIWQN